MAAFPLGIGGVDIGGGRDAAESALRLKDMVLLDPSHWQPAAFGIERGFALSKFLFRVQRAIRPDLRLLESSRITHPFEFRTIRDMPSSI
jgi:hypothetical protein